MSKMAVDPNRNASECPRPNCFLIPTRYHLANLLFSRANSEGEIDDSSIGDEVNYGCRSCTSWSYGRESGSHPGGTRLVISSSEVEEKKYRGNKAAKKATQRGWMGYRAA